MVIPARLSLLSRVVFCSVNVLIALKFNFTPISKDFHNCQLSAFLLQLLRLAEVSAALNDLLASFSADFNSFLPLVLIQALFWFLWHIQGISNHLNTIIRQKSYNLQLNICTEMLSSTPPNLRGQTKRNFFKPVVI